MKGREGTWWLYAERGGQILSGMRVLGGVQSQHRVGVRVDECDGLPCIFSSCAPSLHTDGLWDVMSPSEVAAYLLPPVWGWPHSSEHDFRHWLVPELGARLSEEAYARGSSGICARPAFYHSLARFLPALHGHILPFSLLFTLAP